MTKRLRGLVQLKVPRDVWDRMSPGERATAAWGYSNDDVLHVVSIPWEEASDHEKQLKVRVWEVGMRILQRTWERSRDEQSRRELLDRLDTALKLQGRKPS